MFSNTSSCAGFKKMIIFFTAVITILVSNSGHAENLDRAAISWHGYNNRSDFKAGHAFHQKLFDGLDVPLGNRIMGLNNWTSLKGEAWAAYPSDLSSRPSEESQLKFSMALEKAINLVSNSNSPEIIIAISSHGAVGHFGLQVLSNQTTDQSSPIDNWIVYSDLIKVIDNVVVKNKNKMTAKPKIIWFMNACHSGSAADELKNFFKKEREWEYAVITPSPAKEVAYGTTLSESFYELYDKERDFWDKNNNSIIDKNEIIKFMSMMGHFFLGAQFTFASNISGEISNTQEAEYFFYDRFNRFEHPLNSQTLNDQFNNIQSDWLLHTLENSSNSSWFLNDLISYAVVPKMILNQFNEEEFLLILGKIFKILNAPRPVEININPIAKLIQFYEEKFNKSVPESLGFEPGKKMIGKSEILISVFSKIKQNDPRLENLLSTFPEVDQAIEFTNMVFMSAAGGLYKTDDSLGSVEPLKRFSKFSKEESRTLLSKSKDFFLSALAYSKSKNTTMSKLYEQNLRKYMKKI